MKLLPKDSYDAMRSKYEGTRNIRLRKIADALERKAYGDNPCLQYAHVRKVNKLRDQLSGRNRRQIDKIMNDDNMRPIALIVWSNMPKSVRKYYDALLEGWTIDQCIEADQRMLANAV